MTTPVYYLPYRGMYWPKLQAEVQVLQSQPRPNRATRRKRARQNKKNRNS